ncbi:MAG: hypothetical protein Q7S00_06410, partial [bacterium]|nr:hypothetical protein [bacterium]
PSRIKAYLGKDGSKTAVSWKKSTKQTRTTRNLIEPQDARTSLVAPMTMIDHPFFSHEYLAKPVIRQLETAVQDGQLTESQVDGFAKEYSGTHRMIGPNKQGTLVDSIQKVGIRNHPIQTLHALRYELAQYKRRDSAQHTAYEIADQTLGFESHGGLGRSMLDDLGIKNGSRKHVPYRIFTGNPKLGSQEEDFLTEMLGSGKNLFERLIKFSENANPESLPKRIHAEVEKTGAQFETTNGAFHGVDVIRDKKAIVLHVHSIVRSKGQGKLEGPEHIVIPIGEQSVDLAGKLRDYLKAATGKDVPQVKAQ